MKQLIGKALDALFGSVVFYHIFSLLLVGGVIAIFSVDWAITITTVFSVWCVLGWVLHQLPTYVTHYAPKEDLDNIVATGFSAPVMEASPLWENQDIYLLGQQGNDEVSFVTFNHEAVIKMRKAVDHRPLSSDDCISLWVWGANSFFSKCVTNTFGILNEQGTILEVTKDREVINRKVLAGEYTRGYSKFWCNVSKVQTLIANTGYSPRMSFKHLIESQQFNKRNIIL